MFLGSRTMYSSRSVDSRGLLSRILTSWYPQWGWATLKMHTRQVVLCRGWGKGMTSPFNFCSGAKCINRTEYLYFEEDPLKNDTTNHRILMGYSLHLWQNHQASWSADACFALEILHMLIKCFVFYIIFSFSLERNDRLDISVTPKL